MVFTSQNFTGDTFTNLNNLHELWRVMGFNTVADRWRRSSSWPHRIWPTKSILNQIPGLSPLEFQSAGTIFPIIDEDAGGSIKNLSKFGYQLSFKQTLMSLELQKTREVKCSQNSSMQFESVNNKKQLQPWLSIAENSFGYKIDSKVIEKLIGRSDVEILLAKIEDKPVGTALLFYTDDVCGVHQVGVDPNEQGKGIALQIMEFVIARAINKKSRLMTLQASEVGKGLYLKLGFVGDVSVENYIKN